MVSSPVLCGRWPHRSQEWNTVGAGMPPEAPTTMDAGGLCSCSCSSDWQLWRLNIFSWCETMRQDGKLSFSLLMQTLQKLLLQHMVTMWILKPEVYCYTCMKNRKTFVIKMNVILNRAFRMPQISLINVSIFPCGHRK